jgi:hypothetical protein
MFRLTTLPLLILLVAHQGTAAGEVRRPNVVMVLADDMGWRDTGYSGNTVVKGITLDANSFAKGRIIAVSISSTSLKLSRSLTGADKMEVLDTVPLKHEPGTWHRLFLEMQGREVAASIDGKDIVFGAGERIDVDKTSVQLRVAGESAAFRDLRVREATLSDTWEATKAKLLEARKAAK